MRLPLFLLLTTSSTCLSQRLNAFEDFFERLLGPTVFADPFGDASWNSVVDVERGADDARALGPFGSRIAELMRPLAMFDPFAMMSQIMDAGGFEVPNVTVSGAECLVTVDLDGMDPNNTSIKVYTTPMRIELEINSVQTLLLSNEKVDQETTEHPDLDHGPGGHLRRREGHASVSSFTTIRSFPAPEACEMTAQSSRATVDEERKLLLIKFPKKAEEESVQPTEAPESMTADNQMDSFVSRDAQISEAGWFTKLFHSGPSQQKLAIPIVKNDEF